MLVSKASWEINPVTSDTRRAVAVRIWDALGWGWMHEGSILVPNLLL